MEQPIEELYNEALAKLKTGDYVAAASAFDETEPASLLNMGDQIAADVGLRIIKVMQVTKPLLFLDRFIQLHPSNKDVPYAFYLKALCYYEQISDVGRDQKMTELALNSLTTSFSAFSQ